MELIYKQGTCTLKVQKERKDMYYAYGGSLSNDRYIHLVQSYYLLKSKYVLLAKDIIRCILFVPIASDIISKTNKIVA